MFRTVIVPLDWSPAAEAAVPYTAARASRHGATLALMRVIAGARHVIEQVGPARGIAALRFIATPHRHDPASAWRHRPPRSGTGLGTMWSDSTRARWYAWMDLAWGDCPHQLHRRLRRRPIDDGPLQLVGRST
jgi:nucleotide-binding universal stress UspA family protein